MILTWEEVGHVMYACGRGGAYVQMPPQARVYIPSGAAHRTLTPFLVFVTFALRHF